MKMKKIVCLFTAAVMVVGMLAGCSKGNDDKKKKEVKGRYMEKEITLPEGSGRPMGILWKDEKLVLYTLPANEGAGYQSYTYENQEWSAPQEEAWLTEGKASLNLGTQYIYLGGDGKVYGMAYPESEEMFYGQHILTERDGKAADITPETFLKTDENDDTGLIVDLAVLKDGTLGIGNSKTDGIEFYKDGKSVFSVNGIEINTDHQTMIAAGETTFAVMGEDEKSIDFYDASSLEKKNTVTVDLDLHDCCLSPGKDGVWYLLNDKGIHRITEEGSIVETILDGGSGLMGSNTSYPMKFTAGNEEEFYGLYSISGGGVKLMRYAFDENAPAVQDKTLSVYGLKENATVAQAIYAFQGAHPDVKIEYNTAVGNDEIVSSDDIRTLNAELLNGSGADVLLLDGLPAASYMEKGILTDLSDLAEKLSGEGVLTDVIGNAVQKDGKTYGLPARINVPVLFGTEEETNACQSLEALHNYVQQYPERTLFGKTTHDLIGMTLFHTMYNEIQGEGGGLDEQKLAQLLADWMQICERAGTRSFEEASDMSGGIWAMIGGSFYSGELFMDMEGDTASILEMGGLASAMSPYSYARAKGQVPSALKGYYVPRVIAGVNAASKQQDLAKEFIAGLFAEEVQKTDGNDGFPVQKQALEYLAEYVDTEEAKGMSISVSTTNPETGEVSEMSTGYPTRAEVEGLIELIKGLRTPYMEDQVISDAVLKEMESCYVNEQSPEEAAKAICQKVDTYLAE